MVVEELGPPFGRIGVSSNTEITRIGSIANAPANLQARVPVTQHNYNMPTNYVTDLLYFHMQEYFEDHTAILIRFGTLFKQLTTQDLIYLANIGLDLIPDVTWTRQDLISLLNKSLVILNNPQTARLLSPTILEVQNTTDNFKYQVKVKIPCYMSGGLHQVLSHLRTSDLRINCPKIVITDSIFGPLFGRKRRKNKRNNNKGPNHNNNFFQQANNRGRGRSFNNNRGRSQRGRGNQRNFQHRGR